MLITKRPIAAVAHASSSAATRVARLDAEPRSKIVKGKQVQVSFALPGELLMKVDAAADSLSISRAAFIKQALTRAVKAEAQ